MSISPGRLLVAATILLGAASVASAASGGPEDNAAPAPGASAGALPPLTPVTPFDPSGAAPPPAADPGTAGALPDISATPPPLSSLMAGVADSATTETTGVTLAAGPIETYEFLYREDEEMGVVRERYTSEEAQQRRNLEIARLLAKYQQPSTPGGQPPPQGVDPRAAAEWDFYFEQLQLYAEYVKTKVLRVPEGEDFPMPAYEAETAVQNAEDLEKTYNERAVWAVNDQWNENQEFYERIQAREDRRRDYLSWLQERERELARWTDVWARRINGQNWTDGQPISRDDWYYGQHFNAVGPVLTQVAGQEFLLSREPQRDVAPSTINALSTNLTPYDMVDHHGNVKSAAVERARGSLVRPDPAPLFEVTTGTLELAM